MKANDLTHWGACLLYLRGMCSGLLLAYLLAPAAESFLLLTAITGLVASGLLTPVLRLLGWRRLAERAGDIGNAPLSGEVEHALRTSLDDGFTLQEALRFLHRTRGWDVMALSPAVSSVANVSPKEAIRLVMSATSLAGSEAERQPV